MNDNDFGHSRAKAAIALLIALLVAFASTTAFAAAHQLRYTIEFNESELSRHRYMDYDFLRISGGHYLTDLGKPALPTRMVRIALPDGMEVRSASVNSSTELTLAGAWNIIPSQPPQTIDRSRDEIEFVEPDPITYQSADPFPSDAVRFVGQSDLAGRGIASVEVCPFRYIPATGELVLMTSITLVLECGDGYVCGDYLPDRISESNLRAYRTMLERAVINPADALPSTSPFGAAKESSLPPGAPFDHVIITDQTLAPHWEPLAEWHTRKGLRDTVITTAYIYGSYSGADNQEKIRNFVIDAHDNWGTLYFLIGGEHQNVPFKYRTYVNESIPSDQYYADYDDDWKMEVFVGRVSADNAAQTARFIAKLLKYETDPPLDNYVLDAALLGMDLTTAFDPPYYTLTAGEELKQFIYTEYIPSRFDVTKIYDSYSQNHKQVFIAALNDGQNLVNHCDHSNSTVMGCGERNHGWVIYNGDVDALNNTGKMSVIYSLGCHANEMDYSDCISEHFVIYNDLRAGVAFTGNTRSGWFYVGDPLSLSSRLDYMWWEGLFDYNMHRLGQTLAYTKNNNPYSDNYWKYCQWTLNLLGEPAMPVWTDAPKAFQVTHPTLLPPSAVDFDVNVKQVGAGAVSGAYVCLWKDGDVYETGYTNGAGDVTFSIAPGSAGQMHVTVTKQNFIPHQGSAEFTDDNIPPVCITPGDTTVLLCELSEICIPVYCYDPNGNLESGPTLIDGPGEIVDGHWCYTPPGDTTVWMTVMCQDSAGASCESTFKVKINMNDPPSCVPPPDTTIVQCVPQQVYLLIGIHDPDFNIASCQVVSGPGSILLGHWVYMPQGGNETVNVTVRCTDKCGEYCEASFQVEFQVNQAPVCLGPDDTTIVQCRIEPVSLPISFYDPEGDDVTLQLTMGPGAIVDGSWEYTPSGNEQVHVVVRCTDPCGRFCDNVFDVEFLINDPPICTGSLDTTILQCYATEISLPVPVIDPDDNIVEIIILDGPGSIVGGNWVYTPTGNDTADVTVRCTDACGEQCDDVFRVIASMNTAPECQAAGDTTVSMRSPEVVAVQVNATDPDGNLIGCFVTEGPGEVVDGYWVFTPEKSDTIEVTVRCSDGCDTYCESDFQVVVMLYDCGDADGSRTVDIDDVVYLIGYIFSGGAAPIPVEAGDADCSGAVDIDDAVYMIAYIFSGGPEPCLDCR